MTDSLWRKRQEPEQDWKTPPKEDAPLVNWAKEQDVTIQSLKDLKRSICDEVGKAAFAQPEQPTPKWQGARFDSALHDQPPQPEQEPVAWMMPDGKTVDKWALQFYGGQVGKPLYTHPPQRTAAVGEDTKAWVELEQKDMPDGEDSMFDHPFFIAGMVYANNKLKEKNT